MAKKYIITNSNFTVKRKHKTLTGDTIYERDYMIINGSNDGANGSTSSFKFTNNIRVSGTKRHHYGDWVTCDSSNSEIWNGNCVSGETNENILKIKPNCNSLLDFVYYGNCTELIKSTVGKIIDTFPGELYFTDYEYTISSSTYYLIDNPFEVVLYDPSSSPLSEDIKNFYINHMHYNILSGGSSTNVSGITFSNINNQYGVCYNEGDLIYTLKINGSIEVYCYFINGNKKLFYKNSNYKGISIRPTNENFENFFDGLDDFAKIMMNRSSVPLYTMTLDNPHETENGIETYKSRFTWPISEKGGYNLDITSSSFSGYINRLLDLSTFYDSRRTNNLWRMLTHDSIKNMDHTFNENNGGVSDYSFGTSKIEGLFMAIGRQFDDMKRYIDNIKSCNNISYDGNNNIPDYLLTDKLDLCGWETSPVISPSAEKVQAQFAGDNNLYSPNDVNTNFLKYLLINNKNILSRKGTKHGIEMLLSLFGLKSDDFVRNYNRINNKTGNAALSYDYSINEYVNVVTGFSGNISAVTNFNSMINGFEYEPDESIYETDYLQGLPVRMVQVYNNSGETTNTYLIPWFDKYQELYGKPYFQMYGGWCKIPEKNVKFNGENVTLTSSGKPRIVYDETLSYLNVVREEADLYKISSEKAQEGVIYYVVDVDENKSHYYKLKGGIDFRDNGAWENIPKGTLNTTGVNSDEKFKVVYLETIIDEYKGNNPHSGRGIYDSGAEYLEYFRQLFRGAVKNKLFGKDAYNCNGNFNSGITTVGFTGLFDSNGNVRYIKDNVKVWYFAEDNESPMYYQQLTSINNNPIKVSNAVLVGSGYSESLYESELIPHNFENGGRRYEEPAANSIINNKVLRIRFKNTIDLNYITNSILPYLKQIIPSTTILEIERGA
jgi:hypothetical protein